jgi:hypothetical protein
MCTYHPPRSDLRIWTTDAYNYNGHIPTRTYILEKTSIYQVSLTKAHQKNTCARHGSLMVTNTSTFLVSIVKTNALECTVQTYMNK